MTKKLSKTILNLVLFVSLFSIIIMKVFDLSFEYNEYQNNKKLIKEKFLQQEKKNLKLEVNKAISLI
ncbi:hypothetical protein, partial [Arcobacter sp. CECT 8985]|uniref:hypothetical protein n=1 Tax=Arcobacter sp. CECT 8985 TaxID=1935424 RepID=UPI00102501C4